MISNKIYAVNSARAISEVLDGETIIINLETGTYYSINETGSVIWQSIQEAYSVEQIIERLATRYEASLDIIKKSVTDLVKTLEKENLINEIETNQIKPAGELVQEKKVFVLPKFDKYEDLQEMLLADPIHDVDTAGWPKRKEDK